MRKNYFLHILFYFLCTFFWQGWNLTNWVKSCVSIKILFQKYYFYGKQVSQERKLHFNKINKRYNLSRDQEIFIRIFALLTFRFIVRIFRWLYLCLSISANLSTSSSFRLLAAPIPPSPAALTPTPKRDPFFLMRVVAVAEVAVLESEPELESEEDERLFLRRWCLRCFLWCPPLRREDRESRS